MSRRRDFDTTIFGLASGSLSAILFRANSSVFGLAAEAGIDFARVGAATWLHEQVAAMNTAKTNPKIPERVSVMLQARKNGRTQNQFVGNTGTYVVLVVTLTPPIFSPSRSMES